LKVAVPQRARWAAPSTPRLAGVRDQFVTSLATSACGKLPARAPAPSSRPSPPRWPPPPRH